jgi:hypothetical protein
MKNLKIWKTMQHDITLCAKINTKKEIGNNNATINTYKL